VVLGDNVQLHPGVVIGDDVVIGNDVLIYPNVSVLERCRIGNQVIIHAGTVIGSDGFGYASDGQIHHKIPQTGFVQIDDDVEIGACNTIDRATFGCTHIQKGVKTDNLVHIAHNVTVGEYTIIVARVVIGGSVSIGKRVLIAGGAAISDHVAIGDGAIIGPLAGIGKAVPDGHVVSGAPEMPHRQWLRMTRVLPQLPELKKKVLAIEKQLQKLKEAERT
jgi:UDP-3-O-[3-hydroxymyristoyl] glucosamine N-acyltransferase